MDVVFASGRRSLESLRLAYATTDHIAYPAPSPLIQEAADGAIRLLGARRRLSTSRRRKPTEPSGLCRSVLGSRRPAPWLHCRQHSLLTF